MAEAQISSPVPATDYQRLLVIGLVTFHVVVGLSLLLDPGLRGASDAPRFYGLATHQGIPYVDFKVEYPPLFLLVTTVLAFGSLSALATGVIAFSLICDLALAWMLWRSWGARAGTAYLVLTAPLLHIVLTRLDLLPTILAVFACVLALRPRRQRVAGTVLALAVFAKLWPGALVLVWVARRRWHAVIAFCVTGFVGLAAWVGVAGIDGVRQVLTYRGAKGWEIESLPGTILVALTDDHIHNESGAWRIGHPPDVLTWVWPLAGIAAILAITVALYRATERRRTSSDAGAPALAILCVILVTATLLSPQFLVWLAPWAAITYADGERRAPALVLLAIVLTLVAFTAWSTHGPFSAVESFTPGVQAIYWLRNLCLIAAGVAAVESLWRTGTTPSRPARPVSS